jgi:hypothetical protein
MARRATTVLVATLLCLAPVAGHAALAPYVGTFEGMIVGDVPALANDGWLVYGNVFDGAAWLYGYGPYPAPNDGAAFCAVDSLQGGDLQGLKQLSVYSDYNNQGAQTAGYLVEANVYHEYTISAEDVGTTWKLQFDAKLGNLVAPSTAVAFIKTIDPANNWAMTNLITLNTTAIPDTWNTYSITIDVIPALVGQYMQFGFAGTATNNIASGVYYDNIVWDVYNPTGVGDGLLAGGLALGAPAPNPFQGSTRVAFALPQRGDADVSVFDVTGRHVATLFRGEAEAGPHSATWDGRASDGSLAPSGVYRCVLQTAAGRQSRSLVLSR